MQVVDLTGRDGDARASVRVAPGDEVEVQLGETPSSGYRWVVDDAPAGLELVGDSWEDPDDGVGSRGVRVLRFAVESAAHGELVLGLRRPWLADAEPDATARITVLPAG